ncbi:serine/threonine-protein kinase pim-2-like isoform X2 [Trachinotus anak]|uniref:serine/threonine-protein kinase pim-2-like isoform X2 n=1 Tax=Trachinotus anak TaxID=443729 RepID=UPI0039F1A650
MRPGQRGARGRRAAVTERNPGREVSAAKALQKVRGQIRLHLLSHRTSVTASGTLHLKEGDVPYTATSRHQGTASVAIKHIPQELVKRKLLMINGDVHDVPVEVVLILKATGGPESAGSSAAMYLLDWYDLDQELILVLERPVPCVDLRQYLKEKGGSLQEHEAKIMMQQLVEAAIELHSKQVFHRDIKLENIIVETGPDVPRARVADFSCGCFARKGHYHLFSGTPKCAPPEWYMHARYKARPTTVWQLGVVLYGMLDGHPSFDTLRFLRNKLPINSELSQNCQELLQMCLSKVPKQRPTLEQLQHHPWLQ